MATVFETTECGRCGGTGQYSFNLMHGTRCYGCGGSGRVLTPRGSAARAEFERLTTVTVSELKVGWLLLTDLAPGTRKKWRPVVAISNSELGGGITVELAGLLIHGLSADSKIRAIPNDEARAAAVAKALEFQTAWTPAKSTQRRK